MTDRLWTEQFLEMLPHVKSGFFASSCRFADFLKGESKKMSWPISLEGAGIQNS